MLTLDKLPVGEPQYDLGVDTGIFLWADAEGWHIRMNADRSQKYTFAGNVTSSHPITARPVLWEGEAGGDFFFPHEKGFDFECVARGWDDGIDFTADPDAVLVFDFYINDQRQNSLVFLGAECINPTEMPFQIGQVAEPAPPPQEPVEVLEVTAVDEKLSITDCLVKPRKGDSQVIWMDGDNRVEMRLDRYAIIPREEYEALFVGGKS